MKNGGIFTKSLKNIFNPITDFRPKNVNFASWKWPTCLGCVMISS